MEKFEDTDRIRTSQQQDLRDGTKVVTQSTSGGISPN